MTASFALSNTTNELKSLLAHTLGMPQVPPSWTDDMPLFGNIPDLDSMTIVALVTAIEEHFAIEFIDEDMTMDTFVSLTKLAMVVHGKLGS